MRRCLWGILFVMLAAACSNKPAAIEVSPRTVNIYGLKKAADRTPHRQEGTPPAGRNPPVVVLQ